MQRVQVFAYMNEAVFINLRLEKETFLREHDVM